MEPVNMARSPVALLGPDSFLATEISMWMSILVWRSWFLNKIVIVNNDVKLESFVPPLFNKKYSASVYAISPITLSQNNRN